MAADKVAAALAAAEKAAAERQNEHSIIIPTDEEVKRFKSMVKDRIKEILIGLYDTFTLEELNENIEPISTYLKTSPLVKLLINKNPNEEQILIDFTKDEIRKQYLVAKKPDAQSLPIIQANKFNIDQEGRIRKRLDDAEAEMLAKRKADAEEKIVIANLPDNKIKNNKRITIDKKKANEVDKRSRYTEIVESIIRVLNARPEYELDKDDWKYELFELVEHHPMYSTPKNQEKMEIIKRVCKKIRNERDIRNNPTLYNQRWQIINLIRIEDANIEREYAEYELQYAREKKDKKKIDEANKSIQEARETMEKAERDNRERQDTADLDITEAAQAAVERAAAERVAAERAAARRAAAEKAKAERVAAERAAAEKAKAERAAAERAAAEKAAAEKAAAERVAAERAAAERAKAERAAAERAAAEKAAADEWAAGVMAAARRLLAERAAAERATAERAAAERAAAERAAAERAAAERAAAERAAAVKAAAERAAAVKAAAERAAAERLATKEAADRAAAERLAAKEAADRAATEDDRDDFDATEYNTLHIKEGPESTRKKSSAVKFVSPTQLVPANQLVREKKIREKKKRDDHKASLLSNDSRLPTARRLPGPDPLPKTSDNLPKTSDKLPTIREQLEA
jgi:hypothetical protein